MEKPKKINLNNNNNFNQNKNSGNNGISLNDKNLKNLKYQYSQPLEKIESRVVTDCNYKQEQINDHVVDGNSVVNAEEENEYSIMYSGKLTCSQFDMDNQYNHQNLDQEKTSIIG